jgi:hydrogenase maturation protease
VLGVNETEGIRSVRSHYTTPEGRRVVLGIGNILNRDEGVGVEALEALRRRIGQVEDFELIDGGVRGLVLLPVVEESSHLLVLDAIDAGAEPGTVIELAGEDIPLFNGIKMSEHQVSFQEVLGLSLMRGNLPSALHLLGVQPADISIGLGLGELVEAAVPELVERSIAVLRGWGLIGEPPETLTTVGSHIRTPRAPIAGAT